MLCQEVLAVAVLIDQIHIKKTVKVFIYSCLLSTIKLEKVPGSKKGRCRLTDDDELVEYVV